MTAIVKTVTRRDSATAILRKIGIKPRDYDLFIAKTEDGKIAVKVGAAEKHLKDLSGPTAEEKAAKAANEEKVVQLQAELVAKVVKTREKKASVASYRERVAANKSTDNPIKEAPAAGESMQKYARRMILAGHTNAELWNALVEHFDCQPKHRGYPAWYRHALRIEGNEV